MPPARRPEFEPSFGSRPTEPPIEPRRRDAHGGGVAAEPVGSEGGNSEPVEPHVQGERADVNPPGSSSAVGDHVAAANDEPDRIPEPPPMESSPDGSRMAGSPTLPPKPPAFVPDPVDPDRSEPHDGLRDAETHPAQSEGATGRVGNRWFRVRRRIVGVFAVAVVVGLVYFFVSLAQVWTTGRADDDGPVDAIVVMGAAQYDGRPSPQLAARLDHVVELWPDGVAPLVVVTGGNIPGDRFTEAEASAAYLAERGIPESVLILENAGSNSYESLDAVAELLAERGLSRVLIVTDPYHALRSKLIADEVGLDPSVSSTDTSVVTGGDSLRRHLQEAGGVAVGRIIGFDRLSRLVD